MPEPRVIPTAQPLVLTRDAAAVGSDSRIETAHAGGRLERLRRGVYVDSAALAAQHPTERYRTRVHAVLAARRNAVVTGLSAAALLGLPMVGRWPADVFVLATASSGRRRAGVVEIVRTRVGTDVIDVDGTLMTSVPETLRHVCRTAPFFTALAMVDAALRTDRYESTLPLTTRAELREVLERHLPFRGSRRVERVFDYATPLADTVFETLSRVTIDELGFETPMLQHRLWLPRSERDAWCDFAWPHRRIDGEADGWGKYANPEYGRNISEAERVKLEKRRENEVRGIDWGCARWEWDDAWNRAPLRAILLEAGVPIVRQPRRLR